MQYRVAHNAVLASHDAVYPCVGQGRAHLETCRLFCRDEFFGRIEPEIVLADETFVGDGEDGKTCLERCGIAFDFCLCTKVVHAGWQAAKHVGNRVAICWNIEVLHFPAVLHQDTKHIAINRLVVA